MADVAAVRARNAEYWQHSAPGWIRHADRQDALGRPFGAAAFEHLRPQPGERIVDLGCGCGGTTAELAAAVQPGGEAVGVDLSEAMVAAAARRFPAVRFLAADVETAGLLPGAPYDGAFSRLAVMLFADPVAGCAVIRRSLRPGGRFAASVFRDAAANPWLVTALLGAAPHLGPVGPLPLGDEPGPFAFADQARIQRVLTEAGFDAITVDPHDVTVAAPDDPDAVTEWLIEVGPAGPAYRSAPEPARAAARTGAARLLDRFRQAGDGYHLPAGLWLITATAGAGNGPA